MTNRVSVKKLHLAAYMQEHGATFIGFDKTSRSFLFETDKTLDAWSVQHSNSCCARVDARLINLRNYLKG